jgi:hypothetical protein
MKLFFVYSIEFVTQVVGVFSTQEKAREFLRSTVEDLLYSNNYELDGFIVAGFLDAALVADTF